VRTALVTGGNRGIGFAVASGLAQSGYRVIVGARDVASAASAVESIGDNARFVSIDVADAASVEAAASTLDGPVDILINNAAVLLDEGEAITEVDPDLVLKQLEINAVGALRVTQAFLPGMVARRWGRVVMVSSENGLIDGLQPGAPGYSVSKAALNAVTVLLAERTRGAGVLVNAVSPGRVRTRMLPAGDRAPDEAASGVIFVASLPDDGPSGAFFRDGSVRGWA
jgi:NAD(P)-dependent dehydrogenase (short-subunit alcohol dehydrogenase family)